MAKNSTKRMIRNKNTQSKAVEKNAFSNNRLDLSTIVKATHSISQEIKQEHLIRKIMEICLELTDATYGVLLLNKESELKVVAKTSTQNTTMIDSAAEQFTEIAKSIVRFVLNVSKPLVIADATLDQQFSADSHIKKNKVKSILCIPINNQRKCLGVLYLENRSVVGNFTPNRVQTLEILVNQATTSLENSMLYEDIQRQVETRKQELNASVEELKQVKAQLNQNSKMSALGEMAGGIAHEINTPLAVISMRIEQLEDGLTDGSITPKETLEFTGIVKNTALRIGKIINGLRFFARDGARDETEPVRIHQIIEETLSFCQERFRIHGVDLEFSKTIGTELQIKCRSVEISQVFLNLLNNSFDAIQVIGKKWIRIDLSDKETHVEIAFTDCGNGIPKALQEKILQPFFTTKEVGKGTGLGLSISKGVIESHSGRLYLDTNCPNTRFVIELPKYNERQKSLKESA